jgi:hypothetical protein
MHGVRQAPLGAIVSLVILVAASRGADTPRGTTVPSDPVFKALLVDGTTASGRIRQLGPGDALVLVGEAETKVPLTKVVSLTREGDPPASPGEGTVVIFPDGDRLRAIINAANDTALETLPAALGDASTAVPLDAMLGLLLQPPDEPRLADRTLARLRHDVRKTDVLWLANGDRMTGSFLGLAAENVEFQTAAGAAVTLPRPGVIAIGFDPAAVRYPKPDRLYLELTFTDGSRLGVTDFRIEQGHLVATTRFGTKVRPPLAVLARVHVRSDVVAYLSEREASAEQFIGYLGRHPQTYGRDSTWDQHSLRLAGQPYDQGIGTFPRTLLAYKLDPLDKRFQTLIGLDDRAGEKGNVVFRVLVDSREVFNSGPLTKHDPPVSVDVNVAGGRILVLATEFGEGGDVQDSADWVEARLIR